MLWSYIPSIFSYTGYANSASVIIRIVLWCVFDYTVMNQDLLLFIANIVSEQKCFELTSKFPVNHRPWKTLNS